MNEALTDAEVACMIKRKGLDAPHIDLAHINSIIADVNFHVFPTTQLTICVLTLENGFTVTGESACTSPENFDAEIGREIALTKARDKVWSLEGYLLKQRLFEKGL